LQTNDKCNLNQLTDNTVNRPETTTSVSAHLPENYADRSVTFQGLDHIVPQTHACRNQKHIIMPCPLGRGIKWWCCLTSVRLSHTSGLT